MFVVLTEEMPAQFMMGDVKKPIHLPGAVLINCVDFWILEGSWCECRIFVSLSVSHVHLDFNIFWYKNNYQLSWSSVYITC